MVRKTLVNPIPEFLGTVENKKEKKKEKNLHKD